MTDREVVEHVVTAGGAVALERFGRPLRVAHKRSPSDPVSDVDLAAQHAMVSLLERLRPDDGILAEEGDVATPGRRRWLIDPLDGTASYVRGLPLWSCAAALRDEHGTVAAGVLDPLARELFAAHRGGRATCNDAPIAAAAGVRARDAVVRVWCDADVARDPEYLPALARLARGTGVLHAGGSGSQSLAWVAAGRLHGFVELYPFGDVAWDWLPGELLVRAAGGAARRVDRWRIAAASERLADELLELVERSA
jgi:myo-inositol-1(or 4)-monophosphatase